jgi:inner membrane protein
MDNLAHTLAGALLGEAGLKRRTALAMPTLLIGANLPDIDIAATLFSHSLPFRRGWTHGVLAIVVLPLLLTAGMMAWDRWVRRPRAARRGEPSRMAGDPAVDDSAPADRTSGAAGSRILEPVRPAQLLLLAYIAVLSHPFLDWLNTYGLRWLMPFDGTWFYGDALFIVDPWLWLILLAGVLLARRSRRPGASRVAIGIASAYVGLMLVAGLGGRRLVESGVRAQGMQADDVMVGPVPLNPNRREVVVRDGELYFHGDLVWLPRPRLRIQPGYVESNLSHPAAIHARTHPEIQRFLVWSRYPFFIFMDYGETYGVIVDDARYSDGSRKSWAAVEVELPVPVFPGPPQMRPPPEQQQREPGGVAMK